MRLLCSTGDPLGSRTSSPSMEDTRLMAAACEACSRKLRAAVEYDIKNMTSHSCITQQPLGDGLHPRAAQAHYEQSCGQLALADVRWTRQGQQYLRRWTRE